METRTVARDELAEFVVRMARDERLFIYAIVPTDDTNQSYSVTLRERSDLEQRAVAP